jgi:hypothetical protein
MPPTHIKPTYAGFEGVDPEGAIEVDIGLGILASVTYGHGCRALAALLPIAALKLNDPGVFGSSEGIPRKRHAGHDSQRQNRADDQAFLHLPTSSLMVF